MLREAGNADRDIHLANLGEAIAQGQAADTVVNLLAQVRADSSLAPASSTRNSSPP
jgi:hypothetical protein